MTKTTTFFRKPLEPEMKLALTLRHLASGEKYASMKFAWRVPHNTIHPTIAEGQSARLGTSAPSATDTTPSTSTTKPPQDAMVIPAHRPTVVHGATSLPTPVNPTTLKRLRKDHPDANLLVSGFTSGHSCIPPHLRPLRSPYPCALFPATSELETLTQNLFHVSYAPFPLFACASAWKGVLDFLHSHELPTQLPLNPHHIALYLSFLHHTGKRCSFAKRSSRSLLSPIN